MSIRIGWLTATTPASYFPDRNAYDRSFGPLYGADYTQDYPWANGLLWGNSGMLTGMANYNLYVPRYWEFPILEQGNASYYYIRNGNTIDINGVVIPNCEVNGYLTASDTYIGKVTSDGNGKFDFPSPYVGVNHFLIAFNPARTFAGTTVDTLQAT